jgi:hypothetical protein
MLCIWVRYATHLGTILPVSDRSFALLGAFFVFLQALGVILTLCSLICPLRHALHLGQVCAPPLGMILLVSDRFLIGFLGEILSQVQMYSQTGVCTIIGLFCMPF